MSPLAKYVSRGVTAFGAALLQSGTREMAIGVCVAYALILIVVASIGPESVTTSLNFIGVTAVFLVVSAILPVPSKKGDTNS